MSPELAAIATARGGAFTREEAARCGHSRREIDAFVRGGLWIPLRRGVYVDSVLVDVTTPKARHALDVIAAGIAIPESVGSHESAALVHGLTLWPDAEPRVDLSRPGRTRTIESRLGPPLRLHGAVVPDDQRVMRQGAAITTVARTVADLADVRPLVSACVTAEAALHSGAVHIAKLRSVAAALDDPAALLRVLAIAGAESESVLETVSWVRFHERGMELPSRQIVIADSLGDIGRVDFLWRAHRVIGEADGLMKYRGDDTALIREKLRQERLEQAGYTVVRWGWTEMLLHADATCDRVERALRRAA